MLVCKGHDTGSLFRQCYYIIKEQHPPKIIFIHIKIALFSVIHNILQTFGTFRSVIHLKPNCLCVMTTSGFWLRCCAVWISMCVCVPVKEVWLWFVLVGRLNSTWVWMRLRPLNQRICPRRSSLSAQSISSSSSAISSPSSSPGSRPSPASFRHGSRSVGTVAITWKPSTLQ